MATKLVRVRIGSLRVYVHLSTTVVRVVRDKHPVRLGRKYGCIVPAVSIYFAFMVAMCVYIVSHVCVIVALQTSLIAFQNPCQV